MTTIGNSIGEYREFSSIKMLGFIEPTRVIKLNEQSHFFKRAIAITFLGVSVSGKKQEKNKNRVFHIFVTFHCA